MKTILTLALALVITGAYSAKASDTNCCSKDKYMQTETASLATYAMPATTDMVFEEVVEEEPVFTSIISKVTPDHIVVKVVDVNGNILFEKNESISKVFASNYAETNLPTGSMFLMYVDNIAYYYTK
jgi:hypothetical protein